MLKSLQTLRQRFQDRRRYLQTLAEIEKINAADEPAFEARPGLVQAIGRDRR